MSVSKMIEDIKLIEKASLGEEWAENALLERYTNLVRTMARIYYVAGAELEDVIQEGMIGLFKAIRSYDADREASFKTYAETCIKRQILSAIRKANTQKNQILNESFSIDLKTENQERTFSILETLQANQDTNPEAVLLMKEKLGEMGKNGRPFFSKMEQNVLAEFLRGKSYVEISEIMGREPKSIDNAIQRIRKKLEKHLMM